MTKTRKLKPKTHPLADMMFVKTVQKKGASFHDTSFRWPLRAGSVVHPEEWDQTPHCGGGLHGVRADQLKVSGHWLEQPGEASTTFIVFKATPSAAIVEINQKVKVSEAVVCFSGARLAAMEFLAAAGYQDLPYQPLVLVSGKAVACERTQDLPSVLPAGSVLFSAECANSPDSLVMEQGSVLGLYEFTNIRAVQMHPQCILSGIEHFEKVVAADECIVDTDANLVVCGEDCVVQGSYPNQVLVCGEGTVVFGVRAGLCVVPKSAPENTLRAEYDTTKPYKVVGGRVVQVRKRDLQPGMRARYLAARKALRSVGGELSLSI